MKTLRKRQPPESLETLIDELQHYNQEAKPDHQMVTSAVKLVEKLSLNPTSHKLIDYASESDSEHEIPIPENTMRQEDDSDAESVDSDEDDPLRYEYLHIIKFLFHFNIIFLNFLCRHAGVYTPEEVVLLTRDKLIKLQALYLDQFKRLHHQLKYARRRYLNSAKREKENGGKSYRFNFLSSCENS